MFKISLLLLFNTLKKNIFNAFNRNEFGWSDLTGYGSDTKEKMESHMDPDLYLTCITRAETK